MRWQAGRLDDAAADYRAAAAALRALRHEVPSEPDYAHVLGQALGQLVLMAEQRQDFGAVRPLVDELLECRDAAHRDRPGNPNYYAPLCSALILLFSDQRRKADFPGMTRTAERLAALKDYFDAACAHALMACAVAD